MVCGDRVVCGERIFLLERYAGEGTERMLPATNGAAGEEADGVRAALK